MSDDTETMTTKDTNLPRLGRVLSSIGGTRALYALYGICAVLLVAELFYYKKTYVSVEKIPGFYAFYGFAVCVVVVICARGLKSLLTRPETYYAPTDVESEPYPEEGLRRETIND